MHFLQDVAVILAGAVTLLPVVLGHILAGMIVGPQTPPFPMVHDAETVEMLSELGLHFSLRKLLSVGKQFICPTTAPAAMNIAAAATHRMRLDTSHLLQS